MRGSVSLPFFWFYSLIHAPFQQITKRCSVFSEYLPNRLRSQKINTNRPKRCERKLIACCVCSWQSLNPCKEFTNLKKQLCQRIYYFQCRESCEITVGRCQRCVVFDRQGGKVSIHHERAGCLAVNNQVSEDVPVSGGGH